MIHSGAEQDPVGLEGLAHFVEHLVSENGEVTANEVRGFFEDHGGSVNLGETGYHYTQYKFFSLANASVFSRALSLFGQMLISAKLASQVERERQVVTREFHQKYPMEFQRELDEKTRKVLYKGYSLERFLRPLGNLIDITQNVYLEILRDEGLGKFLYRRGTRLGSRFWILRDKNASRSW